MSVGLYGNVRPADVSVNDIEIFYTYAVNRETASGDVFRINNPS